MKKLFLALFLLALNLSAGELTGAGARALLVRNGLNPQALEGSGMRILAGELTGAGKNINLNHIQYFMTNQEVYSMNEVRQVILGGRAERAEREGRLLKTTLNDVDFLEVNQTKIETSLIKGLVVRPTP